MLQPCFSGERNFFITRQPPIGEKDDYDTVVKTPGSQMGSPAAAEGGGEGGEGGGGRVEREVECKRGRRWC